MCAYRTQRYYSSIIYNNDINKKQNKTYKTTEFVSFFLKTPNNYSDSQNPAQFERKRIRKKLRRRSLTFFFNSEKIF